MEHLVRLRTERIGRAALALAIAAAGIAGIRCGPQETPGPPVSPSPSASDGAVPDAPVSSVLPPYQPPTGADAGLGVAVTDVADTPCSPVGGTSTPLLPGGANAVLFRSLRTVGSRRAADGIDGQGFITFDPDGTSLVSAIGQTHINDNLVAATDGGIFLAGSLDDPELVVYRRYDSNATPQGAIVPVALEASDGLGVGINAQGNALIAWGTPTGLRGRGVASTGPVGAGAFDVALTNRAHASSVSIVDDGDGNGIFAYALSGDDGGGTYQTVFGRATVTGRVGDPQALFVGSAPRRVIQLLKTASGYALLLGSSGPSPFAVLVILDPFGRPLLADRLLGTTNALALAAQGSELGVTAIRSFSVDGGQEQHAPEFRPFDAKGTALGPWVCLTAPSPNAAVGAALTADGTGYAAVYSTEDESAALARFDHLGTGSQ